MSLSEAQYNQLTEDTFFAIEEALDDTGADIDCESSGSVMTIDCEVSSTQIIISRQLATREIWLAAKSGGFHCGYQDDQWWCAATGESLQALLSRVCTEQTGESVSLTW